MLRQIGNNSSKRASIARTSMQLAPAGSSVAVAILDRGRLHLGEHAPPHTVPASNGVGHRGPNYAIELVGQDAARHGGAQYFYVIPCDHRASGQVSRRPQTAPLHDHGLPFISAYALLSTSQRVFELPGTVHHLSPCSRSHGKRMIRTVAPPIVGEVLFHHP